MNIINIIIIILIVIIINDKRSRYFGLDGNNGML